MYLELTLYLFLKTSWASLESISLLLTAIINLFSPSCFRGGPRTAATSKMEWFVIIVNGWRPLTIITKRSILDAAAVLDQPLCLILKINLFFKRRKIKRFSHFFQIVRSITFDETRHCKSFQVCSIKPLLKVLGKNRVIYLKECNFILITLARAFSWNFSEIGKPFRIALLQSTSEKLLLKFALDKSQKMVLKLKQKTYNHSQNIWD